MLFNNLDIPYRATYLLHPRIRQTKPHLKQHLRECLRNIEKYSGEQDSTSCKEIITYTLTLMMSDNVSDFMGQHSSQPIFVSADV